MSAHHFFLDDQVIARIEDQPFVLGLSADDARHAKVLRLEVGEIISVVDADNDYFILRIDGFDGSLPLCSIVQKEEASEAPVPISLVQGIAKGEKFDEVVRGATEVGVESIIALQSSRCVSKIDAKKASRKIERWQTIAKNASMQSGRRARSRVEGPMTVSDFVALLDGDCVAIVFWEEAPGDATLPLFAEEQREKILDAKRVYIVIGPEGGLEAAEVEAITASPATVGVLTLGPTILRTETAGIVAPALVSYELNRLQGR